MSGQEFQENFYTRDVDYTRGSPHLSNLQLRGRLVGVLRAAVKDTHRTGLPLRVLEVGAGHGGYTETALALGCEVTALEMSQDSLDELLDRYGTNPQLTGVHDPDGALSKVGNGFALILAVSVLHHIPDYLDFLRNAAQLLVPGGGILTLQDPLWYERMPTEQHLADRAAFLAWRVRQGNLAVGFASLSRRLRHSLDETKPGDMVEYHVVRSGVDEEGIADELRPHFRQLEMIRYWSNQSRSAQRLGERLGWENTFGISASGYRGSAVEARP